MEIKAAFSDPGRCKVKLRFSLEKIELKTRAIKYNAGTVALLHVSQMKLINLRRHIHKLKLSRCFTHNNFGRTRVK